MIFCELFKQKLSFTTKMPFEAASGENQDYSMYNFAVKNGATIVCVQTYSNQNVSHKTRQHKRQIIRVIPVLLKFWTTVSSTLNEE